jgi:hypothetical protein
MLRRLLPYLVVITLPQSATKSDQDHKTKWLFVPWMPDGIPLAIMTTSHVRKKKPHELQDLFADCSIVVVGDGLDEQEARWDEESMGKWIDLNKPLQCLRM